MHERILIIKLGALGDIIMAAGAIHDIRIHHPDIEITVLTTGSYKKIFERCPWVDKIILDPLDPRWRIDRMQVLNKKVLFESYHIIYDLQKNKRSNFYYRWFATKSSWSGRAPGCSHYYQSPIHPISVQDEFVLQLQTAGVQVKYTSKPDLAWFIEDVGTLLKQEKVSKPYIVLLAGASTGHEKKCWPYYKELAQKLIDKGKCVITVPGPDDFDLCRNIPGIMLKGPQIYLDFFQLAGVLKGAEYVVGNDSGPTHLASHLGVSGLALFGGHIPAFRTGIEHDNFRCIETKQLTALTVEKVYGEVLKSLDKEIK